MMMLPLALIAVASLVAAQEQDDSLALQDGEVIACEVDDADGNEYGVASLLKSEFDPEVTKLEQDGQGSGYCTPAEGSSGAPGALPSKYDCDWTGFKFSLTLDPTTISNATFVDQSDDTLKSSECVVADNP
ncbi:hypothetical protein PYCC9005_002047 [Savitreella phatthalungensis]